MGEWDWIDSIAVRALGAYNCCILETLDGGSGIDNPENPASSILPFTTAIARTFNRFQFTDLMELGLLIPGLDLALGILGVGTMPELPSYHALGASISKPQRHSLLSMIQFSCKRHVAVVGGCPDVEAGGGLLWFNGGSRIGLRLRYPRATFNHLQPNDKLSTPCEKHHFNILSGLEVESKCVQCIRDADGQPE